MGTGRIEAFSDGVFAIIITIMVLELRTPEGASLDALRPLLPEIGSYLLSFVLVGIYWNNHHHLLQVSERVTGGVLWANLHLLFWLSLVPFATRWMREQSFAPLPVAAYGVVLWMSGLAFFVLSRRLVRSHGGDSVLASAIGRDRKGVASLVLYTVAVLVSMRLPLAAFAIYWLVGVIWLVPDRRIERALG